MASASEIQATRVATMAAALVEQFGTNAVAVAERQIEGATDEVAIAWKAIIALL